MSVSRSNNLQEGVEVQECNRSCSSTGTAAEACPLAWCCASTRRAVPARRTASPPTRTSLASPTTCAARCVRPTARPPRRTSTARPVSSVSSTACAARAALRLPKTGPVLLSASSSTRASSRAGERERERSGARSSRPGGMRVLVDSIRSETPRPKSPHMNNEVHYGLLYATRNLLILIISLRIILRCETPNIALSMS